MGKQNLVIIDTGCANLASVRMAFERLGVQPRVSCKAADIEQADKLILPGVGTAIAAMKNLIGGFIVAALAGSFYAAIYVAVIAASCLELKDRLYGNTWDWLDWFCTLIGGVIAAIVFYILIF